LTSFRVGGRTIQIDNLDRVLFPDDRLTNPALPDVGGPGRSMLDSVEAALGWPTPDDLVDGLVGRLG
jgi:hypothetical protein